MEQRDCAKAEPGLIDVCKASYQLMLQQQSRKLILRTWL